NNKITSDQLTNHSRQLKAEKLKLDQHHEAEAGVPVAVTPPGELFLAITVGDKTAERDRPDKKNANVEAELQTAQEKLNNKSFVDRAPAAVVEEHRKRVKDFSAQLAKLKQARQGLS